MQTFTELSTFFVLPLFVVVIFLHSRFIKEKKVRLIISKDKQTRINLFILFLVIYTILIMSINIYLQIFKHKFGLLPFIINNKIIHELSNRPSLFISILVLAFTLWLTKGKDWIIAVEMLLITYVASHITLFSLYSYLNITKDTSQIIPIQTTVINKNEIFHKLRSTVTQEYCLTIKKTQENSPNQELKVEKTLYDKTIIGSSLVLLTHDGYYNSPWVSQIISNTTTIDDKYNK